jgi:ATP-binding cassette, subfamily C, bacterial
VSVSTLLPVATPRQTARALARLARPQAGLAGVATVVLVATTGAALAVPALLGAVIDVVIDGGSTAELDRLLVALVTVTVAQGVGGGVGLRLVGRLGEQLLASLREQVVDRALALPLADVERAGTGDLVARVSGDVDAVANATRTAIPEIISAALIVILTGVGLAALDLRLALAGALAVPIQLGAARWYLRRSGPVYAAERVAEGARAQQLHASVTGARAVRALRLQLTHLQELTERSSVAVELALRAARIRSFFFSRLNAAELVGLTAVLGVGFVLVRDGAVTVGAATAAALYFHRLFDPVGALLFQLDTAQEAGAAAARRVGGANAAPLPATPPNRSAGATPTITLAGVRFAYRSGHDVLHDVDLHVAAGERVALVGSSGAGTSTIARLVAGVLAPTAGTVAVGGRVALITQEVHTFSGTLADDLRLARSDATDGDLHAALATVGADGWVRALPDGLDTVVGAGGHPLGPAEAQQVALARLVLADPDVAVLDEATAEAGSAGARVLDAAAVAATAGRTTVIVAHRLSQAARADRIVVLEAGRVVESGTHDQLVAASGTYAALWSAWSASRPAPVDQAEAGARP